MLPEAWRPPTGRDPCLDAPALRAYSAGMIKPTSGKPPLGRVAAPRQRAKVRQLGGEREGRAQYTVRDVPANIDLALRRKAREEGRSLNQILRDALADVAGPVGGSAPAHHDLDHVSGTWEHDPEFDQAIAAQDRIDESSWQ